MCELLIDIPVAEKSFRASQQRHSVCQARLDLYGIGLARECEAEEYFPPQYGLSVPSAVFL